jgi:hypothetical protein
MKRLTLLTILLVVVGLTAGALEVKPAFTLSGSAVLNWGLDLDTMDTGFRNTATADLVVTLMAADGTDTHAGKDGWYGSITLSDVDASLDAPNGVVIPTPTVAAKIVGMGGMLAIGVVAAPDLALDFVAAIEATADSVVDVEGDVGVDYNGNGTYISYTMSEALMFGFEVVSSNDWTVVSDSYALAFDAQAKFAPLTINAGVNYGFGTYGEIIGLGVKVAADTAMVDGWVGFDASVAGATFAFDVGVGATFTFMETVTAALSVVYGDSFDDLDVKFVLTEPAAKGLVDMLDLTLTAYILDIAGVAGLEYEVILDGGYLAGILYPNFTVTFGDPNNAAALLKVMVGADVAIFPLTKFTLYWTSGDLLAATPVMGTLVAGVTVTY